MLGACETKLFELADIASKARKQKPTAISPIAFEAVQKFDAIFALERSINGLSPAARVAARRQDIAPLVNDLIDWMKRERGKLSRQGVSYPRYIGGEYPRYIGGERNGSLEDCGGIPGFYELLEAIANPTHPNHAHLKEWAGDYDPELIRSAPDQISLGRIANRRNAAKASLTKKKRFGSAA